MSKWKDKYIIGLTGSIGTGKSVVRRMLEHLGLMALMLTRWRIGRLRRGRQGMTRCLKLLAAFC